MKQILQVCEVPAPYCFGDHLSTDDVVPETKCRAAGDSVRMIPPHPVY